jgi:hypothetical protein
MFVFVLLPFFDSKTVAFEHIFVDKPVVGRGITEKAKKDQSTTYCGIIISIPHFVVFFLYKGMFFC